MSKTATVTVRIDPNTKEAAEDILNELGLSVSAAIDMYYKQIVIKGGIPFSLTVDSQKSE